MIDTRAAMDDTVNAIPDFSLADQTFLRALGVELRRARTQVGWSTEELARRVYSDVKSRTLVTYEQGTRQCTVPRLVDICQALNVSAPALLLRAMRRAAIAAASAYMEVDLMAVLADEREHALPLHRWAAQRLAADPDGRDVVRLAQGAVQEMAVLLGYRLSDLVALLTEHSVRASDTDAGQVRVAGA
jgi:transcriptional regulator with XRE-family HTH domain